MTKSTRDSSLVRKRSHRHLSKFTPAPCRVVETKVVVMHGQAVLVKVVQAVIPWEEVETSNTNSFFRESGWRPAFTPDDYSRKTR